MGATMTPGSFQIDAMGGQQPGMWTQIANALVNKGGPGQAPTLGALGQGLNLFGNAFAQPGSFGNRLAQGTADINAGNQAANLNNPLLQAIMSMIRGQQNSVLPGQTPVTQQATSELQGSALGGPVQVAPPAVDFSRLMATL